MNSSSFKLIPAAVAVILVAVCAFQARSAQSSFASASQVPPEPLLLEKNEGAADLARASPWRLHPKGQPKK
jgi:hypothetical protein